MATFQDLDEFFDDTLPLKIKGKTYVVPAPDAETGLFCQRLMAVGIDAANGREVDAASLDDDGEQDMYRRVLGSVYDELIADRVSWPRIKHAGITAFLWIAGDTDSAAKYWASGGTGEAEAPAAGAASSTRSRGSGSGTSRTPRAKATARRSAGKTS